MSIRSKTMSVEEIIALKLPYKLTKKIKDRIEKSYREAIKDINEEDEKYIKKKFSSKYDLTCNCSTFWVKQMCAYYKILMKVHKDYKKENNEITELSNKKIVAAIFYFINPYDVIPDYKAGIGYVDDFYVLQLCLRAIWKKDKVIVNRYIDNES